VFGELAMLDHTIPSPIAAISFTPVEVYAFDYEIFSQLDVRFMPESMQILNEMMNLHNPPADKLAYYFKEKLKWEMKKSRVLQQIK
jgi:CRP-like cAMP-binding protein